MNVLITGGAGFIGSHLAELHIQKGDNVHVIDNLSSGSIENLNTIIDHPHFYFIKDDLLTYQDLPEQVLWADRIYHLAAAVGMFYLVKHPVETLTTNILIFERLLRTANETKSRAHILLSSSADLYGEQAQAYLTEDDVIPMRATASSKWTYAMSKLADELFALSYVKSKNLRITIVRLFNVIGPRQKGRYGMVVPRFIQQASTNAPITVYGDGEQTRSFCDVRDAVHALDKIASVLLPNGEIINLGQDQHLSMNELAKRIKKLTKSTSPIIHVPYEAIYKEPYDDVRHRRPNLKKFYHYTQYTFQWTLERTMTTLIKYYKENP